MSVPQATRRAALALLAFSIVGVLPAAGRAQAPTVEGEFSPYAGSASGTFTSESDSGCSGFRPPGARVRYGGLGAEARLRWRQPPDGDPVTGLVPHSESPSFAERRRGPYLSAAGAMQYETYRLLAPGRAPEGGELTNVPDPLLRGAFRLRGGADWKYGALGAGVHFYQTVTAVGAKPCDPDLPDGAPCAAYSSPSFSFFPDLAVRLGPIEPVHVDFGLGAYNLPTLMQPGLYAGVGVGHEGWALDLHVGHHLTFHGDEGMRVDAAVWAPVTSGLRVGAGGAFVRGLEDRTELEGRLGVEAVLHDPGLGR